MKTAINADSSRILKIVEAKRDQLDKEKAAKKKADLLNQLEQKKLELAKKTKEKKKKDKDEEFLFNMMGIESKIEKASNNLLQALSDRYDPSAYHDSGSRPDFSVPSAE